VQITRVGVTAESGSRFEDGAIDHTDAGEIGCSVRALPCLERALPENDPGYDRDWHCAPQRQLIVLFDGAIEVEVTSGDLPVLRR